MWSLGLICAITAGSHAADADVINLLALNHEAIDGMYIRAGESISDCTTMINGCHNATADQCFGVLQCARPNMSPQIGQRAGVHTTQGREVDSIDHHK